ncbi:Fic family protein [Geofilum rhodophaeum]|uniref:Fic family protein n=1 Tax=Geofilum rhodophaeum TaxID=1965019 RepID=UPI000B520ABE|nr:Fic family protein [Geofilum rhodophaeum]
MEAIFTSIQREKAKFILNHDWAKFSELSSTEIKKLGVIWSYYSAKIEGNAYTYSETEALLIDGVTSIRKFADAQMLFNLHNSFSSLIPFIRSREPLDLNETSIKDIHSEITNGLVENNERGCFRRRLVAITGTDYVPPEEEHQIKEEIARIIKEQKEYSDPLEKAVFLHCNLARLQPFIDGNKRTARMVESLVLMKNNIVPIYSTKDEDFVRYRDGLLKFLMRLIDTIQCAEL